METPVAGQFPDSMSEVSFSLSGERPGTRSQVDDDRSVSAEAGSIQVLAFGPSGQLTAYGRNRAGEGAVTLSLPAGPAVCWVGANLKSDLSSVTSEASLLSRTVRLEDSSPGRMEMYGRASFTVGKDASVSVPVGRPLSKVQVCRVIADFSSPAYRAMPFRLKAVYLVNVRGSAPLGGSGDPGDAVWYNRGRRAVHPGDELTTEFLDVVLQQGGKVRGYAQVHSFWCLPNPVRTDSSSSPWSPRYTRLVLECQLGEVTWYYPVDIPQPEANTLYRVDEVRITGPGSPSPDIPVGKGGVSCTVTVLPWREGPPVDAEC